MNLQTIKSINGKVEYVLLPIATYHALRSEIQEQLKHAHEAYEPFEPADYIDNPVALARIDAGLTQEAIANLMNVSQAYISKVESRGGVTPKLLKKVKLALAAIQRPRD